MVNRQKLFSHMAVTLQGKGQAIYAGECSYFPEDHPGCAIGCQPGFREAFEKDIGLDVMGIDMVIELNDGVAEFFGLDVDEYGRLIRSTTCAGDGDFLLALQRFHDERKNWLKSGKLWRRKSLATFAKKWELKVPELSA